MVEKTVEITKADRKKSSAPAAAKAKDGSKRKRTPTAFFLFMYVCAALHCTFLFLAMSLRPAAPNQSHRLHSIQG